MIKIKKKIITTVLILLFIGLAFAPSINANTQSDFVEKTFASFNGKTLYVGGDGPGNYTKIQEAVDNASDGDTVFVYHGTYYEHLLLNKSLKLIGENKASTKIISLNHTICIFIISNSVLICGFTIHGNYSYHGIYIKDSQYCIVEDNTIQFNSYGIYNDNSSFIQILNNHFQNNTADGISCDHSNNTIIEENNILYNGRHGISIGFSPSSTLDNNHIHWNGEYGITFYFCDELTITNNLIHENLENGIDGFNSYFINISDNSIYRNKGHGIEVWDPIFGCISNNHIFENNHSGIFLLFGNDSIITNNRIESNNKCGIELMCTFKSNVSYNSISENDIFGCFLNWSWDNKVIYNTFIDNHRDAYSSWIIDNIIHSVNIWDGNYWSRARILPKPIFGYFVILRFWIKIPWFPQFDWHPAKEPYDI